MPMFSMSPEGAWMASENHVLDFIAACGTSDIDFAHELDLDILDELFRDPRNPHPKDKLITSALEDEWQPIETAPKDGTQILIFSKSEGRAIASFSHIDEDGTVWWKSGEFPEYSSGATDWLPLPEGPSEEVADE